MSKFLFTKRSSTIHRVEYFDQANALDIEFRSGNVYRYHNVPRSIWTDFKFHIECDGSAGSFFNEYIKNLFKWEKLREASY